MTTGSLAERFPAAEATRLAAHRITRELMSDPLPSACRHVDALRPLVVGVCAACPPLGVTCQACALDHQTDHGDPSCSGCGARGVPMALSVPVCAFGGVEVIGPTGTLSRLDNRCVLGVAYFAMCGECLGGDVPPVTEAYRPSGGEQQ